jgi:polar amino acid transport system permease protein
VRIIAPQVVRTVSPSMATYGIGLLKDSALASTIGVVEMTFRANQVAQNTGQGLTAFAFVGVIYLLLSAPVGIWTRRFDARLREKYLVA